MVCKASKYSVATTILVFVQVKSKIVSQENTLSMHKLIFFVLLFLDHFEIRIKRSQKHPVEHGARDLPASSVQTCAGHACTTEAC